MNKTLTWNDITILDFINIKQIIECKEFDDVDKTVELMKILTHDENIDNLSLPDFKKECIKLEILNSEIPHNRIKKEYIIEGKEYRLIDKVQNLTTGQYIDYCNLCKENIGLENIAKIIAIILIPKDGKYCKGYDIEDLAAAIERDMSIADAYGISDFFVKSQRKLLKASLEYFKKAIVLSKMTLRQKIETMTALIKVKKQLLDLLSMD